MPGTWMLGIETSCDETSAAVVRDGSYVAPMLLLLKLPSTGSMGRSSEVASRQHLEK